MKLHPSDYILMHLIMESVVYYSKSLMTNGSQSLLLANLYLHLRFLGLANYFRQFVPFHSEMVKPRDPKAVKRSPIFWTLEGTNAFNETKIAVSRCPLMYFIDESSPIRLYTDTSDYGIGGVLFQVINDEWKPIAFISKSLSASQINWSTIQKKLMLSFIAANNWITLSEIENSLPSSAICFVFDLYGVGKKKVVRAPLLLHHSNH